jgi:outer membrane autotransporter protein
MFKNFMGRPVIMQGKKNLEKVIALSLLLASVGFGTAGATITSGTYDVGGTINVAGITYVNATSDVTLNANSDVNFSDNGTGEALINVGASGTAVTVNMNNKNLTFTNPGHISYNQNNTNNYVKILNAYDIVVNQNAVNKVSMNISGSGNTTIFQANHDFHYVDNLKGNQQPTAVSTGAALSINAGHDVYINVYQNPVYLKAGINTKLDIVAGNDVNLISRGTWSNMPIDSNSTLTVTAKNGTVNILSTGGNTGSVAVFDANSVAKITAAKNVNIGGDTQRALRSTGGSIDITSNAGTINLTATNAEHNNNAGIYAGKSATTVGTINLHSDTVIKAVTNGIHADGGKVTFDKGLTMSGATTAILATNAGKVTATDTASAKKITGDINAYGDGSSVDVALTTADSYLTGATDGGTNGTINLNLANGGVWNVTDNSNLTDLVNNSTVNMRYTGNSFNEALLVKNLSGNGTYVMNTDLESSYNSKDVLGGGDKIVILDSSSGNNILELRDVSLDKKLASQGYLLLVEDRSNGSATFTGKDLTHGGIFKYKPVITTANPTDYSSYNAAAKNWYLTGFEKTIEVSDNTKATLGLSGTRYANYFMDQDTLLKRLGELRGLKGEPEENGIWARYRHGGMDGDGFSGGSSMVQVGYDKKTSNKRYTGFAFNHTSSTYDFDGGATGDGSQDALTVYNTWLGDKNHYFDIVGKIGKMRGYSTYEDSLFPEKGHYDSWYCSISGEYGRKNINKNGWYYEPQAQLTLGRVRGDDYTTGLGTRVNMASITSLISRAGVTFGKEYNMNNSNTHSNIYGKINWLHEFKGDVHTSLTDTYGDSYDHEKDYGGSWWNAGIGATINVNKNTHMYLDFEKNFGGEVTTNWIGQLGCQWTWK